MRSIGMGFSLILMIGLFSIVWLVVNPKPIIAIIGNNHNLILFLRRKKFLQKYWLTGIFLFFMNAVIFIFTILLLYYIQFLSIPFIHMLVMLLGVVLSIYLWILINLSWQGESRGRLKIGVIGSSFYLFLTAWFIFKLVTLEPLFPGDDTFMASIGFFFGIIVTSVAFITCFILSGFSRRK